MVCHRVHVPDGVKVRGVTADGTPTVVLPGDYVAHRLDPRIPSARPLARLVGADAAGRDVHVPFHAIEPLLAASANDGLAFGLTQAA